MFLTRLPVDSLVRSDPAERGQEKWTVEMELTAQLIEEVSVLAADHRRKKPREVPRPDHVRKATTRQGPQIGSGKDTGGAVVVSMDGYRKAIDVLKSTRRT